MVVVDAYCLVIQFEVEINIHYISILIQWSYVYLILMVVVDAYCLVIQFEVEINIHTAQIDYKFYSSHIQ